MQRRAMQISSAVIAVILSAVFTGHEKADRPIATVAACMDKTFNELHFVSNGRACACVAPGTEPNDVQIAMATMPGGANPASLNNRWTNTATDGSVGNSDTITLTYSFVPDINTGDPETSNNIHALLTGQFGSEAAWKQIFRDMFDLWSDESGIEFVETVDDGAAWPGSPGAVGVRGDIRIQARAIDGAFNVLAFNYFPNTGDMQLDNAEQWSTPGDDHRMFRNTLQHEIGHGLGLDHVNPRDQSKLMEAIISLNFLGPQDDDIRGVQTFYGDTHEPNDAAVSAAAVGAFSDGATVTGCALSSDDDVDFYFVGASAGQGVSVSVTPIGSSYNVGPDPGSPSAIDTEAVQRLRVRVYDPTGSDERANDSAASAGSAASASTVVLNGESGFMFSVDSVDGEDDVQRYSVTLGSTAPPTRTLNLDASTSASVTIQVSPADENSMTSAVTPSSLTYLQGETVAITAPNVAAGEGFIRWVLDGVSQSIGDNPIDVAMSGNRSAVALYSDSIAVDIMGDDSILLGDATTLEARAAGGTGGYTYTWSPTTGLSSASVASPTAAPDETTTYTVTVRDSLNKVGSASFTVTVRELLAVNAGVDQLVVAGDEAAMAGVATGGTPPYLYQWSPVTGLADSRDPDSDITLLTSKTYTLTVTDADGATAQDTVQMSLVQPLSVSLGSSQTIDAGDNVTLNATVTGGLTPYEFEWSPVANDDGSLTDQPDETTTYEVVVVDGSGQEANDSVQVTVRDEPLSVSVSTSRSSITPGDAVTLTASVSGGAAPYTISWSPDDAIASPSASSTTARPDVTTSFRVTVRDDNGASASDSVTVTVGSAVTGQEVNNPVAVAPMVGPCGLTNYFAVAFCGFYLFAMRRRYV